MAALVRKNSVMFDEVNRNKAKDRLSTMVKDDEKAKKERERELRQSKPWYILLPGSHTVSFRDLLSFLALILTFIVVPFEVAFVDSPPIPNPLDPLWLFNRAVDLLFTYDIVLQFFIAVTKPNPKLSSAIKEGMDEEELTELVGITYDFRLSHIFLEYLKGWLIPDLAAMGPSLFEIYFVLTANAMMATLSDDADGGEGLLGSSNETQVGNSAAVGAARSAKTAKVVKFLRATRVMKLFRLLKLAKLLRAIKMFRDPGSPIMRAWEYVRMAFVAHARKFEIFKLCASFILLGHVQACVLGVSSLVAEQRAATWWGTLGYCFPEQVYSGEDGGGAGDAVAAAEGAASVRRMLKAKAAASGAGGGTISIDDLDADAIIPCVHPLDQYMVCMTWALEFNFGIPTFFSLEGPGTPVYLNGNSASFQTHEYATFVLVALAGSLMGVYLQGRVVEVITAAPTTAESVIRFCKAFNVTTDVRVKLQTYFEKQQSMSSSIPRGADFSSLSPSLAQEVMLEVHSKWLDKLPFARFVTRELSPLHDPCPQRLYRSGVLRDHAAAFLAKITLAMTSALLIPKEVPSSGRLYVIVKGVVLEHNRNVLLVANDNWGAVDAICGASQHVASSKSGDRAEALTFTQLFSIDADTLAGIVYNNPELEDVWLKVRAWAFMHRLLWLIPKSAMIERFTRRRGAKPAEGKAPEGEGSPNGSAASPKPDDDYPIIMAASAEVKPERQPSSPTSTGSGDSNGAGSSDRGLAGASFTWGALITPGRRDEGGAGLTDASVTATLKLLAQSVVSLQAEQKAMNAKMDTVLKQLSLQGKADYNGLSA